ncbi:MAG: ribosome assembly cofactor RimP [Tidjanibacter sp.]|nr:ribosome assembly cofactor RimP [Tidjanibacter sp.]MBR4037120.1 ribosome assembly cofactor RimP [Tidjanibacter sp.]MBR4064083.1 ribosome assembly cofactor RimP [Tidjanibacter sp.]
MEVAAIREFVEQRLEGTNMFLIEINSSPANEFEVVVDSDERVDIDSLVELSRAIEGVFDREVEDYELTVISAGIGQPLKVLRQYKKLIGLPVEVLLTDSTKILATLVEADEQGITLGYTKRVAVEGKKRKEEVEVRESYPFDQIKWTKEYLDFK